jgi:Na+-transporting NADH:ubiquinone oxidoreductase subunit D
MGRAEAFAQKNNPFNSLIDGVAAGIGYTIVLLLIAMIRELMGFGSLFGFTILGDWWISWSIMVMAPSAFFVLGLLIWFINYRYYTKPSEEK